MKTTQNAYLVNQLEPLIVDIIELPEQLEVGLVLLKDNFSGICRSQLGEIEAVKGEDRFLPQLMGHVGSGIVLEIAPGVKHVQAVIAAMRSGATAGRVMITL